MSKGKNTLFNYFVKSPPATKDRKSSAATGEHRREKKHLDVKLKNESPSTRDAHEECDRREQTDKSKNKVKHCYELGDLTWAKLEGYPWWPSLICSDPDNGHHHKRHPHEQFHVQFIDEPPSRAWIKANFIKKFTGSQDKDIPRNFNSKWRKSCEKADIALDLTKEDRMMLVGPFPDSHEENIPIDESSEEIEECAKTPVATNARKRSNTPSKTHTSKKKRRIIITDSDSDISDKEYKPSIKEEKAEESDGSIVSDDVSEVSTDSEPADSPVKGKRKRKQSQITFKRTKPDMKDKKSPVTQATFSPVVSKDTKAKLNSFAANESFSSTVAVNVDEQQWFHLQLEFLEKGKRKDIERRSSSHPDFDPTTLHVPESHMKKQTPAMRQWWDIKSQNFDVVLFFKVGKFYELYHMDAVIGVTELGLVFMKGEVAHSGFPEIAYGRYAEILVQKGYKVARVEQTETPQMMEERCRKLSNPSKFDKVMKRELCRITTKATRTSNFIDEEIGESQSSYLLSLTEKVNNSGQSTSFGVCFVDTAVGKIFVGQFIDDCHKSRFRTLVSHYLPSQVLYDKGNVSPQTQLIVNNLNNTLTEPLPSKLPCWDEQETLKKLAESNYFRKNNEICWPDALKHMLSEYDTLGLTAKVEYVLAIKAMGASIWYLKKCKLDQEVLTLGNFEEYLPLDVKVDSSPREDLFFSKRMILDGVTLNNLDVVKNSSTDDAEGTLLKTLDHCNTPFGKRLLLGWLHAPLCNPTSINDRLDAVEDLMHHREISVEAKKLLQGLPDLERLISRIHSQELLRPEIHPDARAIFYENEIYNKRKIEALLSALAGFKTAVAISELFSTSKGEFKSSLLKKHVMLETKGGNFPDLSELLEFFDNAFDHEKAKKEGKVLPAKGVDKEFDNAVKEIKDLNKKLQEYLEKQCTVFGCKVTYIGTGRNRFQLEVPDNAAQKASHKYELQSQRKGFKRYWTTEIKNLLEKLIDSEINRDVALKDIMRSIFATFHKDFKKWEAAVKCLARLDALMSLADYSRDGANVLVRPVVVASDKPFLEIRNGRHPSVQISAGGDEFIPNDTMIGTEKEMLVDSKDDQATLIIITGPNMGGKSTLMRQVGLIVIMAQLGCYVPAESCRFSPVDRIFTRLGASDRLMSGESTFFVELRETSSILAHATKHSLVLIDELGRGTATYDGTAIASSVVKEIASNICCRTMFSTHYHSLVEEFSGNCNVSLGHMACVVENEKGDDPTLENITFLYKMISGPCPKSYGFNAAKLANIPNEIIRNGYKKAKQLEDIIQDLKAFRIIMDTKDISPEMIRKILD